MYLVLTFIFILGSGGRDLSGNKRTSAQEFDQVLTKSNKGIAVSCDAEFNDKDGAEAKNWKKGTHESFDVKLRTQCKTVFLIR